MSEYQIDIAEIMRNAGGYAPEAFAFLRDGLAHASNLVHGEHSDPNSLGLEDASRHVSGQQLCLGLRDLAIQRYGLLARTVFQKWGITETRDFGNIIYALVDANLMRTTEEDTIEDFDHVYEFDEAFEVPAAYEKHDEPVGA